MLENEGATAEVEQVESNVSEPKSMDDTIRETLRSLKSQGIEPETETPEAPEEAAQRIRDDQGKFKAKEESPVVQEAQVATEPEISPPNTWKKDVAAKWNTLPPEVRAEVARREADFHKGIEQYRGAAQFAQAMDKAIQPYAATLQSLNVTPEVAVKELLSADHRLRYSQPQEKLAYFAELAKAYGIDLGQVQHYEPQQIDPNVSALQNQVQQLQGWIQQQSMMGQQQEEAKLHSEISSFASDPKHSHFESVRGHMAALLQAGQAKDLADAYEQAVYANPVTRAAILAEQQEAARKELTQKAQAAKTAASVNTRSRPSMPVSTPIGSMDDTIRATLRRLQGA